MSHRRSAGHLVGSLCVIALLSLTAVPAMGAQAGAAKVARCRMAQLRVSGSPTGAAAGNVGVRVHFRNRSQRSCRMRGYPGVAGLDKKGRQVQQARRTRFGYLGGLKPGEPIPTVILRPGQLATALVEGSDVQSGRKPCREFHGMLVTPPNDRRATRVRIAPPDCIRIQVHPVLRGHTGTRQS